MVASSFQPSSAFNRIWARFILRAPYHAFARQLKQLLSLTGFKLDHVLFRGQVWTSLFG